MEIRDHQLEERTPGLFEPDTMLASQFFDRIRRRAAPAGERRLMVAILEDAVSVYLKHAAAKNGAHGELFRDAEEWIESREESWLYSFENICTVLDLEADYLRRGLRAWKARARPETAREVAPSPADTPLADEFRRASGE